MFLCGISLAEKGRASPAVLTVQPDPERQRYHVTEGGIVVVVREESMIEDPE